MDFVNKQQNNSDKNDDEPKVEMIHRHLIHLGVSQVQKMEKNTYCN
jgi:hypothetical protein